MPCKPLMLRSAPAWKASAQAPSRLRPGARPPSQPRSVVWGCASPIDMHHSFPGLHGPAAFDLAVTVPLACAGAASLPTPPSKPMKHTSAPICRLNVMVLQRACNSCLSSPKHAVEGGAPLLLPPGGRWVASLPPAVATPRPQRRTAFCRALPSHFSAKMLALSPGG